MSAATAHLDPDPHIDIHTLCVARTRDDPFGVAEALREIAAGKNAVTNYRGLPAVSYREMSDFELQQEVCAKAGITGRQGNDSLAQFSALFQSA